MTYVFRKPSRPVRRVFHVGAIDGQFGARTQAAVAAFQLDNHLAADGIVGRVTREALELGEPREVAPERQAATLLSLASGGSRIASAAVGNSIAGLALGGGGAIAVIDQLTGAVSAVTGQAGALQALIAEHGLAAALVIRGRRHGPYRPDLLFLDDIENDEAVRSPEQRQKLENWINRAALKVGPPDGSMDVIWVGTVLHFDAVIVRAAKSPVWNVTEFQAVVRWPDRMDLWDAFGEVFQNEGEEAARRFHAERSAEMEQGAIVNWPSVQPLVWLMLERAASHDAFQTEYQNKPISEGNPFGNLTYWVQKNRDWVFFGAIDPSLGRAGKGRDPSAILIGGFDRLSGTMDVVEASIRKRLPDLIIADTIAFQREYRALLWFVEAVQFQEFLRTTLMATAARQGVGLSAVPVTPSADKNLRIERLQPPVAAGLIRFSASHKTLIDQLQQWPNADHDDGPDCLDMLWQNSLHYASGGPAGQMQTAAANPSASALRGFRMGKW